MLVMLPPSFFWSNQFHQSGLALVLLVAPVFHILSELDGTFYVIWNFFNVQFSFSNIHEPLLQTLPFSPWYFILSTAFFFWLPVSIIWDNNFYDHVSTQANSSMLLHKICMNSLPFWDTFPSHKTHVHSGHNVNLFYSLQRHPIAFSILWHPPFAVLTNGSDTLSKSCCKQRELGSIIECMYNMQSYMKSDYYNPTRYLSMYLDSIIQGDIFSLASLRFASSLPETTSTGSIKIED